MEIKIEMSNKIKKFAYLSEITVNISCDLWWNVTRHVVNAQI